MKKIMFFVIVLVLSSIVTSAQETTKRAPFVSFNGGIIFSANSSTSFVGFVGPKVSLTFKIGKTLKAETAINAFPGLVIKPELKPGLALGSTITLKKDNWKIKPVIAIVVLKTKDWQPMFGVGFVF